MSEMPELLPCPFCGDKPGEWTSPGADSILCSGCGAAITRYIIIPNHIKVLREAWNRRQPTTPPGAPPGSPS